MTTMQNGTHVPVPLASPQQHADEQLQAGEELNDHATQGPPMAAKNKGCRICERSFTVFRPKHTCKLCHGRICDDCSKNRMKLNVRLERKRGSRICDPCARSCMQQSASGSTTQPPSSPVATRPLRRETLIFQDIREEESPERDESTTTESVAVEGKPRLARNLSERISQSETAKVVCDRAKQLREAIVTGANAADLVHSSHLRLRHYISFAVIAVLLLLRIIVSEIVRTMSTNAAASSGSAASDSSHQQNSPTVPLMLAPLFYVAKALEAVVNVRMIGSYVLGLILSEEFSRMQSRHQKPLQVTQRAIRRRCTISALSDASRQVAAAAVAASGSSPAKHDAGQPVKASRSPAEEEEVLQVDTGDLNDGREGFQFDKLVVALERCIQQDEVPVNIFLHSCEYICDFVMVFGCATSFAASTVSGYVSTIDANLSGWAAPPSEDGVTSWKEASIRAVIEEEVAQQIATVGGKKKPSCSRCFLRLLWFIEFVEASVRYTLVESNDENCTPGASKAYEETIGSRHPWLIRKGVISALGSIPRRREILDALHINTSKADGSQEDAELAVLGHAQTHMRTLISYLRKQLAEHDLLDLK